QLLQIGAAGATDVERVERAAIVLLLVAQEAHVVSDAVERGLSLVRFLEQGLRLVVLPLREVRKPELEGDRRIVLRTHSRLLEERRGFGRMVLGHEHDAHKVVGLDVVRLRLDRLLEVGQRLVVLVFRKIEHRLRDVDVGLGGLRGGALTENERRRQRDDEEKTRRAQRERRSWAALAEGSHYNAGWEIPECR